MAVQKVKIAFVGVGGMGQCAHLKNYACLPDCEIIAIAEPRPILAKKVAARYAIPKIYSDHRELLSKEKPNGIVASQPFSRHGILVPELLESKIPVFTEKPIACSLEFGKKIVAAQKKAGVPLMIGYHKRSDPASTFAIDEIKRLRKSGELGKMKFVRISMPPGDWIQHGFDDLIRSDEPAPKSDPDIPAGMDDATYKEYNAFVNYYVHQVNFMRFVLGESYKVSYADPSNVILVTHSESGITGAIEMAAYSNTIDWQESVFVTFEKGWVKINLPSPLASNRAGAVEIYRDPGNGAVPTQTSYQMPTVHAMRAQAANFLKVIRGEIQPPCGAEEALQDLVVCNDFVAARRAAAKEE